jgi:hypothetical protein
MCQSCGESFKHLLPHCSIARELWSLTFSLFGIQWVMPLKVIECFLGRVCIDDIVMDQECHSSMYNMEYLEGKKQ